MTTLQNYLLNLCNRREISKAEFDQMRPKNASQRYIEHLPTSQNLHQLQTPLDLAIILSESI